MEPTSLERLALCCLLLSACGAPVRMERPPVDLAADPIDMAMAPVDASMPLDNDAACAVVTEDAKVEVLPVDIIWIVDNSSSMKPAVDAVTAGLNDFAALIAGKNLDYHIVMLSIRNKTTPIMVSGKIRYPICIPQPLAGDDNCGNGPRFFQSSIDIKSTQPLDQFLGTLAQTAGYKQGEDRGGEPWKPFLRANATKTIVVVTDDNSRLSATDFKLFPGGPNPNNAGLTLPPGLLDPSWMGQWTGFTFNAIYGWGSDMDPSVSCAYQNGSKPASAGPTYTTLVAQTGGVRAKICDGANAWNPFFASVAQAVSKTTQLACDVALPMPDGGALDPTRVNVLLSAGGQTTTFVKVKDLASCGNTAGWYYDDEMNPTRVFLCKAACDSAQAQLVAGAQLQLAFGCQSIIG